ncbi:MAG: hypothetical protein IT238_03790 [Bacteroidia bacterium]|nr:hypothetical protein [Bacteroidia bacterium]MCZ2249551.1 hypothetical protein [Bacteroidia bacterium]
MNNSKHSTKTDLNEHTPLLNSIPKVSIEESFDIPPHYFEKVSSTIEESLLINKNKYSFKADDQYFEHLPFLIQNKIANNQQRKMTYKLLPAINYKIALSAITIIAALGFLVSFYFNNNIKLKDENNPVSYGETELLIDEANEEIITDFLIDNNDSYVKNISENEEIYDYLIEHNVSENKIIEHIN